MKSKNNETIHSVSLEVSKILKQSPELVLNLNYLDLQNKNLKNVNF